jgi:protein SCO1/2
VATLSTGATSLVGPPLAPAFSLVDHSSRQVTEKDFRGRFLLVYFGFTHCRVVCPRTLTLLTGVLQDLGTAAQLIQPLYITVDPQRDSPEVMRAFLESRFPAFLGLTGTAENVAAAKAEFRVFAERKSDPLDPDGYAVPHSATAFLVASDGAYLAHFPDTLSRDEVVRRIRQHVESYRVSP